VGAAVVDDLDIADGADSFEEVPEVLFGGVVGQVAEVDAGAGDVAPFRATALTLFPRGTFLPGRTFDLGSRCSRGGPSSKRIGSRRSRCGRTGSL